MAGGDKPRTPPLRILTAKQRLRRREGGREGATDSPGRGDLVGHYARCWQRVPSPRVTRPRSVTPNRRGRVGAKRHFLPSPRPSSPGNALTDTHRAPSHRFPPHPHSRGEAATSLTFPPRPGVRVRVFVGALPWGSRRGGGWCSPASPAGLSARGSGPWRRRQQGRDAEGLEGAGSPQAAPGEQRLAHLHALTRAGPPPSRPSPPRERAAVGKGAVPTSGSSGPRHGCNGGGGRLIPSSSSSSSPGRARRTAVTGAVARGPAGDAVTNRRGGRQRQRARPPRPLLPGYLHAPPRPLPTPHPAAMGERREAGKWERPERRPALRTAGCGDPPGRAWAPRAPLEVAAPGRWACIVLGADRRRGPHPGPRPCGFRRVSPFAFFFTVRISPQLQTCLSPGGRATSRLPVKQNRWSEASAGLGGCSLKIRKPGWGDRSRWQKP